MKKTSNHRAWKGWLSTAGVLIGVQILLVIFDKIGWSPSLRDDNLFLMRIRDSIMESAWFIDLFHFYTSDIYNFITLLSLVIIVLQTIFLFFSSVSKSD
ncbi:YfzA family protein [Oceanobacillus sojae]|uniref:YfzA family protein n=1 Tax=Oceanobacillus sojae TaxID=582851 RepID=UPI0009887FDD|nr:YfzA family protein [Oceanobacillus sojae]MCT1902600.1 YfzA family protein [Oceanobacillus sojae]